MYKCYRVILITEDGSEVVLSEWQTLEAALTDKENKMAELGSGRRLSVREVARSF